MYNNDYMYGVERSNEYLAHYGIRGMKWGVRKAIKSGNSARLSKQYAKASKKLAKLEKRAANTGKYARRAALMGAGAAAVGGASLGVHIPGVRSSAIGANRFLSTKGIKTGIKTRDIVDAADRAQKFGAKTHDLGSHAINANRALNVNGIKTGVKTKDIVDKMGNKRTVSNSQLIRAGGLAVGGALAVGAAKNAYRAATAKKKAAKFKSEMNKAFAGTQYANGGQPRQGKKRRRR